VYLASIMNNEKVSQTQISKAAAISSVTIRNLCKKLKDAKIASFANPKLSNTKEEEKEEFTTYNSTTRLPNQKI